jgi:hypothetical protein
MLAGIVGLSLLKLVDLREIRSRPDPVRGARPWDAALRTRPITTPNRSGGCGLVCETTALAAGGLPDETTATHPPGLLAGVVEKVRDTSGRMIRVRTRALFGRLGRSRPAWLPPGISTTSNTAHLERLHGTLRGEQARLVRRGRCVSRDGRRLQWSLWLWRDLYNWVRVHESLHRRTPAMAFRLTDRVWPVLEYIRHPVHADDLTRAIWAEQRQDVLTSALDREKRRKTVPTS